MAGESRVTIHMVASLDGFIARFYEALLGAGPPPVSLAEVRESVSLVERLTSEGLRL